MCAEIGKWDICVKLHCSMCNLKIESSQACKGDSFCANLLSLPKGNVPSAMHSVTAP